MQTGVSSHGDGDRSFGADNVVHEKLRWCDLCEFLLVMVVKILVKTMLVFVQLVDINQCDVGRILELV